MRGTLSRADLRQVLAATYHQVWWPPTDTIKHDDANRPVWHGVSGSYFEPATGEVLPTWDQALDAIGDQDEPLHVARFGQRFDAQGVIAGSRDANRCIGYLTKYLTKHVADCHQATSPAQREHADRLADALRYEPCSPTCSNWLRYGVQPKNTASSPKIPGPDCAPGTARAKRTAANTSATPGGGSWSPANGPARPSPTTAPTGRPGSLPPSALADADPARYTWEPVSPSDPDHMPPAQRLLHVVADRQRWHAALTLARARASDPDAGPNLPATTAAA